MLAVPARVGENVDVQVAEAVVPLRVHVVKDPVTPVTDNATVPVGVIMVPGDVSVTVTVQVDVCSPTVTGLVQLTVVLVALGVTVIELVPLLPL